MCTLHICAEALGLCSPPPSNPLPQLVDSELRERSERLALEMKELAKNLAAEKELLVWCPPLWGLERRAGARTRAVAEKG